MKLLQPIIFFPMNRFLNELLKKGFIKKKRHEVIIISLFKLIIYFFYNIIEYYNSIYICISTYYKICTFHNFLRKLYYILLKSCTLTIALKMKLKTVKKVIKIYGKNLTINENNSKLS